MACAALDDPRNRPDFQEALAGTDSLWRFRKQEYFVDVADDGYVIASGPELDKEEELEVSQACEEGEWPGGSRATNCLVECRAGGCACTRSRNPIARSAFTRTAVKRLVEVAQGHAEVAYASLGSGFLRFDFTFLEILLAAGVPVTAVHLVDSNYDPEGKHYEAHRVALAQFAAWFSTKAIDVYAHDAVEKFAFRSRQANLLPVAVLQVDCSELTWVFDEQVKPMLEEVLAYGGLFCALTAREGTSGAGGNSTADAWGEIWRLTPETGRMKLVTKLRYRPGEGEKVLADDDPLPKATSH